MFHSAFADIHTQGVCIDTPGSGVVSLTRHSPTAE